MTQPVTLAYQPGDRVIAALETGALAPARIAQEITEHPGYCAACDHNGVTCPGPFYEIAFENPDFGTGLSYGEHELTTQERLADETAAYIADVLIPQQAEFAAYPEVTITYPDDRRPPTTVEDIKATLLGGHFWLSWLDDRVCSAMRALHS